MAYRILIITLILVMFILMPWEHNEELHFDTLSLVESKIKPLLLEELIYRIYVYFPGQYNQVTEIQSIEVFEDNSVWSKDTGFLVMVEGSQRVECLFALEELQSQVELAGGKLAAWQIEAFSAGGPADLALIGEEILDRLNGKLSSIYQGRNSLNVTARVPQWNEGLVLAGQQVNINLELFYDHCREQVRVRLGVPLIVSGFEKLV